MTKNPPPSSRKRLRTHRATAERAKKGAWKVFPSTLLSVCRRSGMRCRKRQRACMEAGDHKGRPYEVEKDTIPSPRAVPPLGGTYLVFLGPRLARPLLRSGQLLRQGSDLLNLTALYVAEPTSRQTRTATKTPKATGRVLTRHCAVFLRPQFLETPIILRWLMCRQDKQIRIWQLKRLM